MILKPILWYCFCFASTAQKAFVCVLVTAFSTHTKPRRFLNTKGFVILSPCSLCACQLRMSQWDVSIRAFPTYIYIENLRKLPYKEVDVTHAWNEYLRLAQSAHVTNNAHFLRDTNWEKFAFDSTALSYYGKISYKIANFPSSTNSTWWREEVTQRTLPKSSRISLEEEKSGRKFGVFTARRKRNSHTHNQWRCRNSELGKSTSTSWTAKRPLHGKKKNLI